jgi:hypothetical protein
LKTFRFAWGVLIIFSLFVVMPITSMMIPLTIKNLTEGADAIVIGNVTDIESKWTPNNVKIITIITISVNSTLKGNITNKTIKIFTNGGTIEGESLWVEDEPIFKNGSIYGIFLKRMPDSDVFSVYGKYQGLSVLSEIPPSTTFKQLNYNTPEQFQSVIAQILLGEEFVQISNLNEDFSTPITNALTTNSPVIYSIQPSSASAGTNSKIIISGSGFGTKTSRDSNADVAFFFNYDTDHEPLWIFASGFCNNDPDWRIDNTNDIVSWTNTEIVVNVPSGIADYKSSLYHGSASSGPIYVLTDDRRFSAPYPFEVTFSYGKAKWFGNNPSIPYYVNTNLKEIILATDRASNTWNSVSNVNCRFDFMGQYSLLGTCTKNGANEIAYGITSDQNTLAESYSWTSQYPLPYGELRETDITFNRFVPWSFGTPTSNQYDFQTTILHEFGHWLKLNDLYGNEPGFASDTEKVMYGLLSPGEVKRMLSEYDKSGIRYIYPANSSTPPTTIPTPIPSTFPTTVPTSRPPTQPTTRPTTTNPTPQPTSVISATPAEFWGGVVINGEPAPIGSIIIAKINGIEKGRIIISKIGEYGGSGAFDSRLIIIAGQSDLVQGSPVVTFWLNGIQAYQTLVYTPGMSQELSLTFGGSQTTPALTPTPVSGTDTITLYPGWNFVSTPKSLADGKNTMGYVFGSVNVAAHSVFRYNAQDQTWEALSSTTVFKPLDAIWIFSNNPTQTTLNFKNSPLEAPPTKQLYLGWNAIGSGENQQVTAQNALLTIQGSWAKLIGFNAASQSYDSTIFNSNPSYQSTVSPTKGYWVFMTANGVYS